MIDVEIFDNTATEQGGGLAVRFDSTVSLLPPRVTVGGTSQLSANSADFGGGVYTELSTFTLDTDASIHGNMAHRDGGGIQAVDGITTLIGTITNNTASVDGGGVY